MSRAQALRRTLERIAAGLFMAWALAAQAAPLDANRATQAELESIKGIGPSIAMQILEARRESAFKDWQDLIARVKGIGTGSAAKFSAEGLTVNGSSYPAKP